MLADFGDSETDHFLPWFIRLQKLVEDVNHTFEYDNAYHSHDAVRVEIFAKNFQQQLSQLAMAFPAEIWSNRKLLHTPSGNTLTLL